MKNRIRLPFRHPVQGVFVLWVVFEVKGPVPDAFRNAWKRIDSERIPSNGYELAELPAIEAYISPDLYSPETGNEIWPAVKSCSGQNHRIRLMGGGFCLGLGTGRVYGACESHPWDKDLRPSAKIEGGIS